MNFFTGLLDKNNNPINIGDTLRFSTQHDMLYPEEAIVFIGKASFACGAYGISSNEYIPDEVKLCGNDNFVSFWEIYNMLELVEFDYLSDYLEIIEECIDCPFNSKCENQTKCKENIDA